MTDPATSPAEACLTLFPWRKDQLDTGDLYDFAWRYELPITREDLWPYLIDSSRFNKAVGYDGITYSEENGLLFGSRGEGKTREEWVEYPFEWSRPFYVHRMRKYSRGFITYNKTIFHLEALANHCAITVYIGNISAHPLSRKLVPAFLKPFEEKYRAAFDRIVEAAALQKSAETIFDLNRIQLSDERQQLLDRLIARLPENIHANLRNRLRQLITGAEIEALAKIRPLALAREWNEPADAVLRLLLHATRAGILTLTWNTICPHCRGERDSVASLGSIPEASHCTVCDIDFTIGDLHSVEVNFRLNSQIADLPRVMYCAAEPAKKRHVIVQQIAPPGETLIPVSVATHDPTRRIRYQTAIEHRPLDTAGKAVWSKADLPGGGQALLIKNSATAPVQLICEDLPWAEDILTPGEIFRLQDFRDLFSEEHLGTQLKLDVGEQTIMFTDLVGSTRFYEEAGDAQAFGTLRNYFRAIYDEARRAGGAVVKTIGDGAMLVFADPASAMRAGLRLIAHFGATSHRIRITLHSGPCLAVNFNTGIDYFGKTVNLAAKLQGDCQGQQILCTQAIAEFQGVSELVRASGVAMKSDSFEHPSFSRRVPVFRIG